jgi:GH43 family beta-xylosidase
MQGRYFKTTIGYESSHEISNDNGVRAAYFATSKTLVVKSTTFPHRNIHKHNWTSLEGKKHNQIDHILIDRRWNSSMLDVRSFRGSGSDTDQYLVVAEVRKRLEESKQSAQYIDMERINLKKLN